MKFYSNRYPQLSISTPYGAVRFEQGGVDVEDERVINLLVTSAGYPHKYFTKGSLYLEDHEHKLIETDDISPQNKIKLRYEKIAVNDVTIVIGTYKNPDLIEECLYSIKESTPRGYKVIVAFNGGDTRTGEILSEYRHLYMDLKVVKTKNPPFSVWANRCVDEVKTKYVVHLNDDTIVQPYWLESMLWLYTLSDNIGMVGKDCMSKNRLPTTWDGITKPTTEKYIVGYCVLMKKEDAYWDEEYKSGYMDFDKSHKMIEDGKTLLRENDFPIVHYGGKTRKYVPNDSSLLAKDRKLYETRWRNTPYFLNI